MNFIAYCVGFEQIDFDGLTKMCKSTLDTEDGFKNILGNPDGHGMFAVGIHVLHAWFIPCNQEITEAEIEQGKELFSNASYFFRLAKKDPSFKVLTGSLEV